MSRDLLGHLEGVDDRELLVPWQSAEQSVSQEKRETKNQENRNKKCMLMKGSVCSIKDGIVEFRFTVDMIGNTLFYAKAPKIDELTTLLEGQQVQFHLGFSYSGLRAWDIVITE